jgi:uncharacterized protein YoxC
MALSLLRFLASRHMLAEEASMSVLLEICAVVSTLCLVATAVAVIRVTRRFELATDEVARTAEVIRTSVKHIEQFAGELEALMPSLRRIAAGLESLGDRAVKLSNAVLDEVEGPIQTTMAVLSGVRAGTRSLVKALSRRASRSSWNGGQSDERASAGSRAW